MLQTHDVQHAELLLAWTAQGRELLEQTQAEWEHKAVSEGYIGNTWEARVSAAKRMRRALREIERELVGQFS